MRGQHRLLLAVTILALASVARAEDPALAVLGVEAVDVPHDLAQGLTDALRQRAAATQGLRILPAKDLVEMKMVFSCDELAPACMAQAGKSLGADKLLYGTLTKQKKGAHIAVSLRLLDVKTGNIERQVNDTAQKRELGRDSAAAAARWFSQLILIETKPILNIMTSQAGADVEVDGAAHGKTPVTIRDLSVGKHNLVISQPGRVTDRRTIELTPGGRFDLSLTLEEEKKPPVVTVVTPPVVTPPAKPPETGVVVLPPEPIKPLPPRPGHPGRTAKYVALGAGIGAVVAASVAIYTWRTYVGYEDSVRNNLTTVGNQTAMTAPLTLDQQQFFKNPNCNIDGRNLASGTALDKAKADCNSGQSYANATTALWVVAGGLAAAGVVAVIIGDRQAKAAERKPSIQQSLRILPAVGPNGGALQASFEF
jgi:hypothetical protein